MDDRDGAGRPITQPAFATVNGQAFRDCIARLPSGVHVITTDGPHGVGGFTATAVASVSDDPPTVLVCLNRSSAQSLAFRSNGCFAVNLLPAGSRAMADAFAGRTGLLVADRYALGAWDRLTTGAPVLEDAVMTLDCRLVEVKDMHTHAIYFGVVVATRHRDPAGDGRPDVLIYRDRRYSDV